MRGALNLLALLAMLLMPFGMAPAAADATHHQTAAMPMPHCPEPGSSHQTKDLFAQCTMACSAALPTADVATDEPLPVEGTLAQPAVAQVLHGLHPETATPPPKTS